MKAKVLMMVCLLSFSVILFAQPNKLEQLKQFRMQKDKMGMQMNQARPMMGLNLTDAQKESFKKSMLELHKQLQPIRNELGEAEARQKTLTTAEKTDMGAINKNLEKIGAIKVEMAKIMTKHRLEMRAQLTDEQRLKFDMFKGKMMQRRGLEGKRQGMRMNE